MITLVKAVQTAMACPSQWDAWDAEGRYYYLRFRHGCGSVESAPTKELWRATCVELPVSEERPYGGYSWPGTDFLHDHSFEFGNEYDGHISLELFCEKAGITLTPDCERTAYGRYLMNSLTEKLKDDPAALARADQLLGGVELDKEQL
jgi:hypothetical protein